MWTWLLQTLDRNAAVALYQTKVLFMALTNWSSVMLCLVRGMNKSMINDAMNVWRKCLRACICAEGEYLSI